MNDFAIGIPIFNKSHMMHMIINGLVDCIKEEVDYYFIFDGCTDNSLEVFKNLSGELKGNVNIQETPNLYPLKTHNILLKRFENKYMIIFQDDMILKDNSLLDNIRKISSIYNDTLGVIGCRDGFDKGWGNFYSSKFSTGTLSRTFLEVGEFREISSINFGPIVFPKTTVNKVGCFDEAYFIYGGWEDADYGFNCKCNHGLTNIILGTDLIHDKFESLCLEKIPEGNVRLFEENFNHNNCIFKSRWGV